MARLVVSSEPNQRKIPLNATVTKQCDAGRCEDLNLLMSLR